MDKFNESDGEEIGFFFNRFTANQFWESSDFPEKLGFQRFGLQLREEDLAQSGIPYLGFFLRDRSESRKANSGFSVVTNDAEEFKVELDVWPFMPDEVKVYIFKDYFKIQGVHSERFEDDSYCSRSFRRYYAYPRGSIIASTKSTLNNGIVIVSVKKEKVANVLQAKRPTLGSYRKNESVPSEVVYGSSTPTEVRQIAFKDWSCNGTVPNGMESSKAVSTAGQEPKISTESSKAVSTAGQELRIDKAYEKVLEDLLQLSLAYPENPAFKEEMERLEAIYLKRGSMANRLIEQALKTAEATASSNDLAVPVKV